MFVVSLPVERAAAGRYCLWSALLSTCSGRGSIAKGRHYISGKLCSGGSTPYADKVLKDALALGEDQNTK